MSLPTKYIIAYLLLLFSGGVVFRGLVRRDYIMRGRLTIPVSILQALLFFTYGGFPYLYLSKDWPRVYVSSTLHVIGVVFVIAGLASLSYGMLKLGFLPSVGGRKDELECTGIYRISRNPQALACSFYVLGFSILWPSWYALSWAVLYVVFIHVMIITEEEHLLHLYGASFEEYCDEVPRYICIRSKSKGTAAQ